MLVKFLFFCFLTFFRKVGVTQEKKEKNKMKDPEKKNLKKI